MATLLQKFVDAGLWESEDAVGRLGLVAHAAFLHAGFVPYGAKPTLGNLLKQAGDTGSCYLSRRYTAPELAHREGAEAAVLLLCRAGGGGAALLTYLTTDGEMRRTYRQGLDSAAMAPLLSGRLEDVEPWGSRICKWLAEVACGGLLAELCRRNGLPRTCFTSLPEDVVVEILNRIISAEDMAGLAWTSRGMRELVVAECRNQLRKEDYSKVWAPWPWHYLHFIWSLDRSAPKSPPAELPDAPEPEKIASRRRSNGEGQHRKVSRIDYSNKGRAVGAIQSPSSRYRWKQR
ncbi:unnamed protein product [Urochloa humidicola]